MPFFRRLGLAFACFFRVLLGRPLPAELCRAGGAAAAIPPATPPPSCAHGKPEEGAVALLSLLQREGRLVDFLEEDIADYSDEKIGAAVREVWKGCRRALEEHVRLEPVLDGDEGGPVHIEAGFDPDSIRLVGAVRGSPPFRGTLRHPGWRVARIDLPRRPPAIIAPAEVEL